MSDARTFGEAGYLVRPGFLAPADVRRLRAACDHVLSQLLADPRRADSANIAFLTRREYFRRDVAPLIDLLEAIATPTVRAQLAPFGPAPLRFFNTQYFHEQRTRDWDGAWHRDTQFEAPDAALERRRILQTTALHFRIAFEPDDRLELVPGSHRRWDTPDELAIRRGDDPSVPDMPGRQRIELQSGDACIFHAWMIHRGTYRVSPARRTFDVIYGLGPRTDFGEPAPVETFLDPEIRRRLSAGAVGFYDASYADS